nr:hypothetical protein [Tanacetum cinerariifolium]
FSCIRLTTSPSVVYSFHDAFSYHASLFTLIRSVYILPFTIVFAHIERGSESKLKYEKIQGKDEEDELKEEDKDEHGDTLHRQKAEVVDRIYRIKEGSEIEENAMIRSHMITACGLEGSAV